MALSLILNFLVEKGGNEGVSVSLGVNAANRFVVDELGEVCFANMVFADRYFVAFSKSLICIRFIVPSTNRTQKASTMDFTIIFCLALALRDHFGLFNISLTLVNISFPVFSANWIVNFA